jgi:hypothetical protein
MAGPTTTDEGQTLTDGTEQVLGTYAGSKYYQFSIDLTGLAAAETLKVRWYKKVFSSGTTRRFQVEIYTGDYTVEPLSPVVDSGPFWIANEAKLTIQQTAGSFHTFSWEVLEP